MNNGNQSFLTETKQAQELFNIDASDHDITSVLRNRINASEKFYDSNPAYKLSETRKNNAQMLFGDHYKAGKYPSLRDSSVKYTEQQIYAAVQTIVSYLTSRIPEVEARSWNNSVAGRMIARDFAKYVEAHGVEHDIRGKAERVLYDAIQKRVGAIKLVHDTGYRGIGEICPRHIDPSKLVFDHNAGLDDNPGFIAEKIDTKTVGDLVQMFPDKKDELFEMFNIKQGTQKQLDTVAPYFEVWVTGRDKKGNSEEQLVIFIGGLVLLKTRNPHWLYDVEQEVIANHLPMPPKPYILCNIINDGSNKIDQTSIIELVAPQQHALNRLQRQIVEATERYGGLNVFSGEAVDKEDVEELNFDGDESIVVDSEDVTKAVMKVTPDFLPEWLMRQADRLVATLHSIIGTPPNMRGDTSDTETLGEAIMQRDQAEGRLEPFVRALDNFFNKYYSMLFHLMKVYYTEEHWKTIAGDDGTFDYVMMSRDRLADGMDVFVKSGSMLPLDDNRLANVGIKLAEMNRISNRDLYNMLKLPNADEMVENLVKEQVDPTLVVQDINKDEGDKTAYMDYEVITAGKYAPPREDPEAGHIETHRKQMMSDEFQSLPQEVKQAFITHLQAEMESLRRRAMAEENALAAKDDAQTSPMVPGNVPPEAIPQPGMPVPPQGAPAPAPEGGNVAPTPTNPEPMASGAGLIQ